jgi:hypothetical protein
MAVPTWVTGQILTASDVNNWFVPIAAFKPSATVRNSVTLTADTDLTLSVAASAVYEISAGLIYQGATTVNFLFNFAVPSGAGGGETVNLPTTTVGQTWTTTVTAAGSATVFGAQLMGVLTTVSAGTFALQWASGTGGTNMTLGGGSYLVARRVG